MVVALAGETRNDATDLIYDGFGRAAHNEPAAGHELAAKARDPFLRRLKVLHDVGRYDDVERRVGDGFDVVDERHRQSMRGHERLREGGKAIDGVHGARAFRERW